MSRQRRNFSAKFKSNLVIELLKGELNNLGLIPGQRGHGDWIIQFRYNT